MRTIFLWVCYRIWMAIPVRWNASKPALWLLQYAGECAYRVEEDGNG